jgi:hypothetical protein
MPIGATIGSAVIGAGANLLGGNMQASAANNAANLNEQQYQQTRSDLLPYNKAGQTATNALLKALPSLTAPVTMDEATLRQTPGYQFNLNQGLKSVQNGAAARGLDSSGAALKGAAGYATGLADSTYQNQFNNAVTNKLNAYNMLSGVSSLGENAAAQTGAYGTQAAANAGNALTNAGTAQAAGLVGAGNSLVNGLNTYGGYQFAQQNPLLSSGIYGSA